jgi:hypothetical protein
VLPLLAVVGIYAAQLAVDDEALDPGAALAAAGLLVTAELAYWSLEERDGVRAERGEALRRIGILAGMAVGAVLTALLLLALVDAVRTRGLAIDLVGAAAAAAALAAIVLLARRRAPVGG